MLYLSIAIAAFYAGVFVHPALHSKTKTLAALDSLIVLAVLGLLGFSLLPHTFEESGVLGGLGIGLGFSVTLALDRLSRANHRARHPWALGLVIGVLLIHATFDGAALALPEHHQVGASHGVVIGVLLHRLPLGMVVHHLLGPQLKLPILVATLISTCTALGFAFADQLFDKSQEHGQHLLEAFIVGMLVQVVVVHIGTLKKIARPFG
jgi:hypothetical protein